MDGEVLSGGCGPVEGGPEESADHWPVFTLGPAEYERAVADIARTMSPAISNWKVHHLDPVDGTDGTYVIDVTARFRLAGMDFLVLFECKRHASAVKREHVQVLHSKMQSTGAQKGVVVAASGFQSGALRYAQTHGIACVRLVDDAWTYMSRATTPQNGPQPTEHAPAIWSSPTPRTMRSRCCPRSRGPGVVCCPERRLRLSSDRRNRAARSPGPAWTTVTTLRRTAS